jgi:hypothetical protein
MNKDYQKMTFKIIEWMLCNHNGSKISFYPSDIFSRFDFLINQSTELDFQIGENSNVHFILSILINNKVIDLFNKSDKFNYSSNFFPIQHLIWFIFNFFCQRRIKSYWNIFLEEFVKKILQITKQ